MNKKFTIVAIMIVLLGILLSPTVLSSDTNEEKSTAIGIKSIFASSPEITIDYDETAAAEYVIPNSESVVIPINVSFKITGAFAKWHELIFKNKNVNVELSIVETPDWCTAEFTSASIKTRVSGGTGQNTSLKLSVNENAPAFQNGVVKIRATSSAIKGLLGIITKVTDGNFSADIPFTVGYFSAISLETEGTYLEIPPLNVTHIPINITNLGNGPTQISVEVENISDNLNVSYVQVALIDSLATGGDDNKATIVIDVMPNKHFSQETIIVKITPSADRHPELTGKTYILTYVLKNDGSYAEEENGIGIDTTLLIGIITAIFLILILLIILKRKR